MHRVTIGCGAAAALLLVTGSAWAEPRVAEIGRITVDGDKAELSGDIEVGGELLGTWEFSIRKVEAQNDELVLMGTMTGRLETGSAVLKETVDGVRVSLSDPQAVCGEMLASADVLRFDRLGLVVYELEREADMSAKTARGRTLNSLLCAATHVIDGEDAALMPMLSTLTSLANREVYAISPQALTPGRRTASAQQVPAAPPVPTLAPAAPPALPAPPVQAQAPVVVPVQAVDPGMDDAGMRARVTGNTGVGPRVISVPVVEEGGVAPSTNTITVVGPSQGRPVMRRGARPQGPQYRPSKRQLPRLPRQGGEEMAPPAEVPQPLPAY